MPGGRTRVLVLATAAIVLLAAPGAKAAFPGTNGKIAFNTLETAPTAHTAVRTVNPDGTGGQDIAQGSQGNADWSPDGKRIAFATNDGVSIVNADGSTVTTIAVSYVAEVAWSPDGQRLALVRLLTAPPPPCCPSMNEPDAVWVVNVDGTGLSKVTTSGNCAQDATDEFCTEIETVSWSPDGAKLAYTRADWYLDYEMTTCFYCRTPQEVWRADPNVTGSDNKMPGGAVTRGVDWSPNGQKLLLSDPLRTVNPDGTGLTSLGAAGFRAVWSPDGSKIAYQTQPAGTSSSPSNIYTRNADGSGPQLVSANSYAETGADWQPVPIGYPRPKGATPVYVSLVPAYSPCVTANRTHGAPLSFGSCSPPSQTSSQLTVGSPDANGALANSIGSANFFVQPGDPSTVADEADIRFAARITDVRLRSDLSDYTGQLTLRLPLRVTDKDNTGAGPGTMSDSGLAFPMPCAATASASVGATCSTSTTIEAAVPGSVKEGRRAIWELGQLAVDDGDNTPFAVQGVFVP